MTISSSNFWIEHLTYCSCALQNFITALQPNPSYILMLHRNHTVYRDLGGIILSSKCMRAWSFVGVHMIFPLMHSSRHKFRLWSTWACSVWVCVFPWYWLAQHGNTDPIVTMWGECVQLDWVIIRSGYVLVTCYKDGISCQLVVETVAIEEFWWTFAWLELEKLHNHEY